MAEKFKPVKCRGCGIKATELSDMYDWVLLDGLGIIKDVRNTGNMFAVLIEKGDYCSLGCMVDHVERCRVISDIKDKKIQKRFKKKG